jgi:hypothetical protein
VNILWIILICENVSQQNPTPAQGNKISFNVDLFKEKGRKLFVRGRLQAAI